MDRMIPLKAVLEACMEAHLLGDEDRYMPWRFMGEHITPEECQALDNVMHTFEEGDSNVRT